MLSRVACTLEGSVWEAVTMRDAGVLVASSREVRRLLAAQEEQAPRLAALAAGLADLAALGAAIARAVDDDGRVRDDASPELARLRREIGGARSRIVSKLWPYCNVLRDDGL